MVMLPCLPKHAARPVALCETGSGSGWWLHFVAADGQVVTGPHVRFVSGLAELASETVPVYLVQEISPTTGMPVTVVWLPAVQAVQVRTWYADGKPYVFLVFEGGRVAHWEW